MTIFVIKDSLCDCGKIKDLNDIKKINISEDNIILVYNIYHSYMSHIKAKNIIEGVHFIIVDTVNHYRILDIR